MIRLNVIAFTHTNLGLDEIGRLHLEQDKVKTCLQKVKDEMNLDEIMYLSTCNRVEFIFVTTEQVDEHFVRRFMQAFNGRWKAPVVQQYIEKAKTWNGINAVNHLVEVASSVDSMVIGEREIITQVRNAYEQSKTLGLSGDIIRVVTRQTIETAKKVYTETSIATKPVSVVSLAFHALMQKRISKTARILVVGAGTTNTNMCRFLKKEGFKNFTVFNRTLSKAKELAKFVGGKSKSLDELADLKTGFDILITCTGADHAVISPAIYKKLAGADKTKKVVIDLAIPADLDVRILKAYNVDYISVEFLKTIADTNLKERRKELIKVRQIIYEAVEEFKEIFKVRQVELKMRAIPERVKEIRSTAVNEVFSRELSRLDPGSKEVLDKILNYMEKKYISVPMLIAKEMLIKSDNAD